MLLLGISLSLRESAIQTEGVTIENARRSAVEVFTRRVKSSPLKEERNTLRPTRAGTGQ